MRAPNLSRFLAAETGLQPVLAKAQEIDALSKLCAQSLPPELARLVRVANYRDGTLVFLAANGAAAAKLKLLSGGLCKTLSRTGRQVNSVSVRVQPTVSNAGVVAGKRARLSAVALAELQSLHRNLRDSPARNALKLLLNRNPEMATPEPPDARRPSGRGKAGPGRVRT